MRCPVRSPDASAVEAGTGTTSRRPAADSSITSGRPGAAKSPGSTIRAEIRPANGAATRDSRATDEAASTAPSPCWTAPFACSYCIRAMSSSSSEAEPDFTRAW